MIRIGKYLFLNIMFAIKKLYSTTLQTTKAFIVLQNTFNMMPLSVVFEIFLSRQLDQI